MIGYLIVPDISARAFFLLQGVPHSGKSVLGRFIEEYFPSDLVNSLDITRLGGKYLPEGMEKCRLNLSMDLADGELPSKSVAMIKMLTGGDLVTKEVKYKDAKPYRGQCKFLFSTNHKLKMKTWDKAFLERLVCIPFKYPVSKEEEDVNLLQHLEDEREAITMKALFYYRKFVANKQIFAGTGRYNPDIEFCSSESDTIKAFVEEKCVIVRPNEGATYTKDLYEAYLSFCAENSFTSNCNSNGFGERLSSLYKGRIVPARWRSENRNDRGFRGIVLLDTNSNDYGYDDYDEQQYDIQVFNV